MSDDLLSPLTLKDNLARLTFDRDLFRQEIDRLEALLVRERNEYAKVERERDEARQLAREYYFDIEQMAGEHQWENDWATHPQEHPWLKEAE